MKTWRRICLISLLLTSFVSAAVAVPPRPEPQRLVNDLAGLFTSEQVESLEHRLVALDDSTSNQIVVLTVNDLDGYDPAEFAVRTGQSWGVGTGDFNNGVVLLVKPRTPGSDGRVSIQVGYGLEGAIPDAYCKRIIENDILPHFREGDYYGGVSEAVDILSALASGEVSVAREHGSDSESAGYVIAALILFLFIVWMLARHGGKRGGGNPGGGTGTRRSSPDIFFGPAPGSFGGSGGFGGSSGGGSFGGFGGGSFGGGGASGRF